MLQCAVVYCIIMLISKFSLSEENIELQLSSYFIIDLSFSIFRSTELSSMFKLCFFLF